MKYSGGHCRAEGCKHPYDYPTWSKRKKHPPSLSLLYSPCRLYLRKFVVFNDAVHYTVPLLAPLVCLKPRFIPLSIVLPSQLEKFKFVLDYKFKELKRQIEPREKEISDLRSQIEEMDLELEQVRRRRTILYENLQNCVGKWSVWGSGVVVDGPRVMPHEIPTSTTGH